MDTFQQVIHEMHTQPKTKKDTLIILDLLNGNIRDFLLFQTFLFSNINFKNFENVDYGEF